MNIGIDIDNVISNYKRKKVNVILDTVLIMNVMTNLHYHI